MMIPSFVPEKKDNSKLKFLKFLSSNHILRLILILSIIFLPCSLYAQQVKIMPLGNSITHGEHGSNPTGGFRDDLADMLINEGINFDLVGTLNDGTDYYPYHEGHPGRASWYLADNITSWLSSTNPDIILLHIGTNDINDGRSNITIVNDIERILENIWSYNSSATVLLADVIPRNDSDNYTNTNLCRQIHDLSVEKLASGKPIRFVGQNEIYITHDNWRYNLLYDAFHPNNTGYNAMAKTYFNILMNELTGTSQFITDNFDRSSLGITWQKSDPYTLSSNKITTSSGGDYWWKPAVYAAEMDPITVSFSWGSDVASSADGNAGLALHLQGASPASDGYLVYKEAETNNLKLYSLSSGSVSQLIHEISGIQGSPVQGDEFRVSIYSDYQGCHFSCFINDNYDGDLIDPNNLHTGGDDHFAGIMLAGTSNNIIDDFKMTHIKGNADNIHVVYGDEQEGEPGAKLSDSLVVMVTDKNGYPISGVSVDFQVTQGEATIDPPNATNHFDLESENATVTYPMQIMTDAVASNGKYVEVPQEYADDSSAKVAFSFNVAEEADFVIWGRVQSGDGYHDSFWVNVDEQADVKWHISGNYDWAWKKVHDDNAYEPVIFHLTAGPHTLYINNREWGSKLDKVIITSDMSYDPSSLRKPVTDYYLTNSTGRAYAVVTLGYVSGQVKVNASSPNFSDYEVFSATVLTDQIPTSITIVDGNNQNGLPNETLPKPLTVEIKDAESNIIANIGVKYEIIQGSGASLAETGTVVTDAQGRTSNTLTLGSNYGTYKVQVSCPGYSVSPAIFDATVSNAILAISGNCTYYNNSVAINDVTLTTSGSSVKSATSGTDGTYQIQSLDVDGDYTVTPERAIFNDWASHLITTYHAALAVRYYAGLTSLTTNQAKAADVDKSGSVDAYDAALIAQFAVGLSRQESSYIGEWLFIPAYRSYFGLNTDYSGQDYTGILLGDVTGDWDQTYNTNKQAEQEPIVWLNNINVTKDEIFKIPIELNQNEDIISWQLHLKYDPESIQYLGTEKSAEGSGLQLIQNITEEGNVYLGMYSFSENANELSAMLKFKAIGADGKSTQLNVPFFQINNGLAKHSYAEISINSEVPETFALFQNYPNPFNPSTTFRYQLPETGYVKMIIYNITGQQIAILENKEKQAGEHTLLWSGLTQDGSSLPSGVYFCHLHFGNQLKTIKLVKIK